MKALMLGSTMTTSLILFLANVLNGRLDIALVSLGVGMIWLIGQWRALPGVNSVGFVALVVMVGISVGTGSTFVAGLFALVSAIIVWDLGHLRQRLTGLFFYEVDPLLFRLHLNRLMVAVGLGIFVPLLGLIVQVGLTMVWAIVLGVVITISLSLTLSLIRRYSD